MSCSVCAANNATTGGVYLFERNGTVSLICNDCWKNFSLQMNDRKIIKNEAQRQALNANIGVESQLFHLPLSPNKTLAESFCELRAKKYKIQQNPLSACVFCS